MANFGVPRLTGWADELGDSIPQLGNAIATAINPNFAIQQELRKRIAQDPTTLQKLQDMEANNPGSVVGTFGKQAAALLTGSQSSENITERATRDALTSGKKTKDIVADDTALGTAVTRGVTGQNQAGYRSAEAGATVNEAAAKVAPKKAELDLAKIDADLPHVKFLADADYELTKNKLKITEAEARRAVEFLEAQPNLKKIKMMPLAEKIAFGGQLDEKDNEALTTLRAAGQDTMLRSIADNLQQNRRLVAEERWHREGKRASNDEQTQTAIRIWNSSGKPGTVAAFKAYLYDPDAAQVAEDIRNGTKKPETFMEKQIAEIVQKEGQDQGFKNATEVGKLSSALNAARTAYDKAKGGEKAVAAQNVNIALENLRQRVPDLPKDLRIGNIDKSFWPDKVGFLWTNPKSGKEEEFSSDDIGKITAHAMDPANALVAYKPKEETKPDGLASWEAMAPAERETKLNEVAKKDPNMAAQIRTELAKKKGAKK